MGKRKSHGRSKGRKGRSGLVQCQSCGAMVPADKAKKVTKYVSWLDARTAEILRESGAQLPRSKITKFYCISCAVHRHVSPARQREKRRGKEK